MSPPRPSAPGSLLLTGSVALLLAGSVQIALGLAAVLRKIVIVDEVLHVSSFGVLGWGWLHVLLGTALTVLGGALLRGATWTAPAAIVLLLTDALTSIPWLPVQPGPGTLLAAIDVAIVPLLIGCALWAPHRSARPTQAHDHRRTAKGK